MFWFQAQSYQDSLSLRFQVARGVFLKTPIDFLSQKLNNIQIKNNVKNDSARSS